MIHLKVFYLLQSILDFFFIIIHDCYFLHGVSSSMSMREPGILKRTWDFLVSRQAWFLSPAGSQSSVDTDIVWMLLQIIVTSASKENWD